MAQPADKPVRLTDRADQGGELTTLRLEFNKMVNVLRILTAKLDLDAGVTDTNFAALVTAADAASPARITTAIG